MSVDQNYWLFTALMNARYYNKVLGFCRYKSKSSSFNFEVKPYISQEMFSSTKAGSHSITYI